MRQRIFTVIVGACILFAGATNIWAQVTAQISGTARDQSGAVLPVIVVGILLAGAGPQASPRLVSVQHIPKNLLWCDHSTKRFASAVGAVLKM